MAKHIEYCYEQVEHIINCIRNGVPRFQLPRITIQYFEQTESPDFNTIVEDLNVIRYRLYRLLDSNNNLIIYFSANMSLDLRFLDLGTTRFDLMVKTIYAFFFPILAEIANRAVETNVFTD